MIQSLFFIYDSNFHLISTIFYLSTEVLWQIFFLKKWNRDVPKCVTCSNPIFNDRNIDAFCYVNQDSPIPERMCDIRKVFNYEFYSKLKRKFQIFTYENLKVVQIMEILVIPL